MCLLQLLEDPASVRSREGSGHRDTSTGSAVRAATACTPRPVPAQPPARPCPGRRRAGGDFRWGQELRFLSRNWQVRAQPTTEGGPARGRAPGGADDTGGVKCCLPGLQTWKQVAGDGASVPGHVPRKPNSRSFPGSSGRHDRLWNERVCTESQLHQQQNAEQTSGLWAGGRPALPSGQARGLWDHSVTSHVRATTVRGRPSTGTSLKSLRRTGPGLYQDQMRQQRSAQRSYGSADRQRGARARASPLFSYSSLMGRGYKPHFHL